MQGILMTMKAKTVIPNKEWIVKTNGSKIGALIKDDSTYAFVRKGQKFAINNIDDVKDRFGADLFKESISAIQPTGVIDSIFDFPCRSIPYEPMYDVARKLPIYSKSSSSKSLYCAGYYLVKFKKGWVTSFCPKLITLERYPFHGPYKTETEMKDALTTFNNYEKN